MYIQLFKFFNLNFKQFFMSMVKEILVVAAGCLVALIVYDLAVKKLLKISNFEDDFEVVSE